MPRGARPGRQLESRSGGWFDHLTSAAGGDRRIPFLACGHDRVQLAQQRGSNGCVGLPTVELVLGPGLPTSFCFELFLRIANNGIGDSAA